MRPFVALQKSPRKQTSIMIIFFMMVFSVSLSAQKITISKVNAPLQTIFSEIEKQSKYSFFYNESLLGKSNRVTVNVKDVSVEEALNSVFQNQPLTYSVVNSTIVVKRNDEEIQNSNAANSTAPKKLSDKIGVSGKVTTQDGKPIAGATVTVKETGNATSTDKDGIFRFNAIEDNSTLLITSVSYLQQEVKLNKRAYLAVLLEEKVGDLDEAIVVAYNTTTQRTNVGAVTVVKGEEIQNLPNRSFDKSLQGLVPGLLVTQGSGQPGGGLGNFVLRGIATGGGITSGATVRNPLIVVDGVPVSQEQAQVSSTNISINNPMAQLNPSDIESISVLKDAAAIALYGTKASNGVILVTTKKGKAGKTVFSFRHQTDFSERLSGDDKLLNQQEYLELLYEAFRNTDAVLYTDAKITDTLKYFFPTRADGSFYPQENWTDELYNPFSATISNQISMSGGNDKQNFYLNLEWTKQDGIEKTTGYDRKSIRFNYESFPADWLKLGLNTALSYNVQDYSSGFSEIAAFLISPLNPIRGSNGDYIYAYKWGFAPVSNLSTTVGTSLYSNPVAEHDLNTNKNVSYRGLSRLYGEIKFLKYFTFTPGVGIDFMLTEGKERVDLKLPGSSGSSLAIGTGRNLEKNIRTASLITTNTLRFNRMLRNHQINVLAGQEAQIVSDRFLTVMKDGITSNPVSDQLTVGTISDAGGAFNKKTYLSYFGQANYSFKGKYLFTSSIRTDGSSLFGENHRFGSHWSIGAGWIISSESFMKQFDWLDFLKLRGSFGSAGNSAAILNSLRYDLLMINTFLDGTAVYPSFTGTPGNRSIQWEKTFTWDAGLEMRLLKERISLSADIYCRNTSKLFGSRTIPFATGYSGLISNIGDLKNTGVEIAVSLDVVQTKNFQWNINANWSTNKNRLTSSFLKFQSVTSDIVANGEGKNYNSYYLVRWAGVDPATGKPQWIDSTGKPNSIYAAAKPDFVGKPQPDGFGGVTNTFSYKGIELSAMFYYQYGFQIYNNPSGKPMVNDGLDPFINQSKSALNRWQKPGDIAENPRRLLFGKIGTTSDDGNKSSTRFLTDGDYIRLSNLTLAYNFPRRLIERLHLTKLKVYLQGYNLAIWTKYSGRQDPDNINALGLASFSNYPIQRSYTVGLQLNF